jgi:hypothetical protein
MFNITFSDLSLLQEKISLINSVFTVVWLVSTLLSTLVVSRTLLGSYDLRQYQSCSNTSYVGARGNTNLVPVLYQLQYQVYIPASLQPKDRQSWTRIGLYQSFNQNSVTGTGWSEKLKYPMWIFDTWHFIGEVHPRVDALTTGCIMYPSSVRAWWSYHHHPPMAWWSPDLQVPVMNRW